MPTWSGHWRCTEQGRGGATASRPGTCRATGIQATTGAIFLRRAEGADDAGRMDGNNAMLCAAQGPRQGQQSDEVEGRWPGRGPRRRQRAGGSVAWGKRGGLRCLHRGGEVVGWGGREMNMGVVPS